MSNLGTPSRKQSNASHPSELAEQGTPRGGKREHQDDVDDDESDETESVSKQPGEKRAGRRKIKIEYIDDKSRRHITFSKRKAGIMKKAYELSTLTGTQVLLLVVSETGLVYTFTTPKLQPLVTKPEGKNLIQQCLNAPDNPQPNDATTPTRTTANAQVYGSESSTQVDSNSDNLYDGERKHQSPGGQMPAQHYPAAAIGLGYNQYSGIPNSLPMNAGALQSNYMAPQYPQHAGQQYLGQYAQGSSPYMQQQNYWQGGTNGNGNGNAKVQQFPNQTPEKK